MIGHILLPGIDFADLRLPDCYADWLHDWLKQIEPDIECGEVSASLCLQGLLAEILLFKKIKTDWLGILRSYLVDDSGEPLAYSEQFGKKLYKFNHWKQTVVHAVHAHWWIKKTMGISAHELSPFSDTVLRFIQSSGWIFNPMVSNTNIRTRMKSELMMSLAMGIEILAYNDSLTPKKNIFEALLSSAPVTGYLSAEYFRMRALIYLNAERLAPVTIPEVIAACEAGKGYCDFSLKSKVDDYMGTAKRTSRDKLLHSALLCLYAKNLASKTNRTTLNQVLVRLKEFGTHLLTHPFDIEAFKMRDIDVPFGTGLTPLEVISASHLMSGEK